MVTPSSQLLGLQFWLASQLQPIPCPLSHHLANTPFVFSTFCFPLLPQCNYLCLSSSVLHATNISNPHQLRWLQSMLQNFLWNHKEKQNFPILTEKPFKIWSTYTFQHYLLPSLPSPRPHYAHHASLLAIPRTGLACLPRIFVYVLPFACVIPLKTESMDYC